MPAALFSAHVSRQEPAFIVGEITAVSPRAGGCPPWFSLNFVVFLWMSFDVLSFVGFLGFRLIESLCAKKSALAAVFLSM